MDDDVNKAIENWDNIEQGERDREAFIIDNFENLPQGQVDFVRPRRLGQEDRGIQFNPQQQAQNGPLEGGYKRRSKRSKSKRSKRSRRSIRSRRRRTCNRKSMFSYF